MDEHAETCTCHSCTAARLSLALINEWHTQFISPLILDMRFQFDLAAKSDAKCGCGNEYMSNAIEEALIAALTDLLGSATLNPDNTINPASATVLLGKVTTRLGFWMAGLTDEPPEAPAEEFDPDAPEQNAPTTQVPQ